MQEILCLSQSKKRLDGSIQPTEWKCLSQDWKRKKEIETEREIVRKRKIEKERGRKRKIEKEKERLKKKEKDSERKRKKERKWDCERGVRRQRETKGCC